MGNISASTGSSLPATTASAVTAAPDAGAVQDAQSLQQDQYGSTGYQREGGGFSRTGGGDWGHGGSGYQRFGGGGNGMHRMHRHHHHGGAQSTNGTDGAMNANGGPTATADAGQTATQAAERMMLRLDTNGDGAIDLSTENTGRLAGLIGQADTDGDGSVTTSELAALLTSADTDGNGTITHTEMHTALKAYMATTTAATPANGAGTLPDDGSVKPLSTDVSTAAVDPSATMEVDPDLATTDAVDSSDLSAGGPATTDDTSNSDDAAEIAQLQAENQSTQTLSDQIDADTTGQLQTS